MPASEQSAFHSNAIIAGIKTERRTRSTRDKLWSRAFRERSALPSARRFISDPFRPPFRAFSSFAFIRFHSTVPFNRPSSVIMRLRTRAACFMPDDYLPPHLYRLDNEPLSTQTRIAPVIPRNELVFHVWPRLMGFVADRTFLAWVSGMAGLKGERDDRGCYLLR